MRMLDIGPGPKGERLDGFETLDIERWDNVDHVADAAGSLPFPDNTFDVVHASHILEHIPWQHSVVALKEWVRIIKPGGWLEVWVPDGLKACRAFVEAESGNTRLAKSSPFWKIKRVRGDACRLGNAYLFALGGISYSAGWHKAMFSNRYLKKVMKEAGLKNPASMKKEEMRVRKYEWINMGVKGQKP